MLIPRYIAKELLPQFFSTLIVMTAILAVSQLVRLSELIITFGLSLENVLLPFLFVVLPFLTYIIPIAFFFAVLLGIGRLNADGEYVALLAAGYSLRSVGRPIWILSGIVYLCGATCASYLEPWGRREMVQFVYRKSQTQLDNLIRFKLQPGVFMNDFVGYMLYAEHISPERDEFRNLILAPSKGANQNFLIFAPRGRITGSVAEGQLRLSLRDGRAYNVSPNGKGENSFTSFRSAHFDLLRMFQDKILGPDVKEDDYRSYPPQRLQRFIQELASDKDVDLKKLRRARMLLHRRLSIPFATVIFGLFALTLAVQDSRRGRNRSFSLGILTIVISYVIVMGFSWMGEEGKLPITVAAWLPHVLLGLVGVFVIYQKNRLPISENIFAWSNLPFIRPGATITTPPPEGLQ